MRRRRGCAEKNLDASRSRTWGVVDVVHGIRKPIGWCRVVVRRVHGQKIGSMCLLHVEHVHHRRRPIHFGVMVTPPRQRHDPQEHQEEAPHFEKIFTYGHAIGVRGEAVLTDGPRAQMAVGVAQNTRQHRGEKKKLRVSRQRVAGSTPRGGALTRRSNKRASSTTTGRSWRKNSTGPRRHRSPSTGTNRDH